MVVLRTRRMHSSEGPDDFEVMQPPKHRQGDRDRNYFEDLLKEKEEKDNEKKKKEEMRKKKEEEMKKEEDEEEEEEEEETRPDYKIVKYFDLLDKLWGWDLLVPYGGPVSWSVYNTYLEAYYLNTETDAKSLSIADIAKTCRKREEELVSELKTLKKSNREMILPLTKSIVLSCLIQQCANSVIHAENFKSSAVSSAALWCITKEADLTLELLSRGAHPYDDPLIDESSKIRMCALSLMNCTLRNSDSACAAMCGIAKEAEMMCKWMVENGMLLDFYDDSGAPIPALLSEGSIVRHRTLNAMYDMLEESAAAASGGGGGHNIDGAANTTGISDILYSHYWKIEGGKKSNRRKRNRDGALGELWGWGRLYPHYSSVEWSKYLKYLKGYYRKNASEFIAGFVAEQNIEDSLLDPRARAVQSDNTAGSTLAASVANYCVKMEEELVSKWKTRVPRRWCDTFTISTIIESRLIKECILAICSTEGKFPASAAIAFMCIAKEADLMCELLKHVADPSDDIIEQSRVIRMCALGLANLKGHQSIASAAAMLGMAKEAELMLDCIKRENKLDTNASPEPAELDGRAIRTKTLDVMTRILLESSFP